MSIPQEAAARTMREYAERYHQLDEELHDPGVSIWAAVYEGYLRGLRSGGRDAAIREATMDGAMCAAEWAAAGERVVTTGEEEARTAHMHYTALLS